MQRVVYSAGSEEFRIGYLLEPDGSFPIWEENWPVWLAFRAVRTQWRQGPSGATGLDMTAVFSTWDRMDIQTTPELIKDIQLMEDQALTTWAKARERDLKESRRRLKR